MSISRPALSNCEIELLRNSAYIYFQIPCFEKQQYQFGGSPGYIPRKTADALFF